ncbi:MAG: molybdopterin-synthase adenylyltransferase MoeB [Thermoanaerobaculia bacterium]
MTVARSPEPLSHQEIRRYGRHLILPEVGKEGQERLKGSCVLLIGAGGLGCPAALYLAAAGVGTLGLAEFDEVDETNLQRQILYAAGDVGRSKIDAAVERLRGINPHVAVEPHEVRVDVSNALDLISGYDLVVDGSDNFATRYLVNDACVLAGKPDVFGSIFRFEGQVSVFCTDEGPCYRCLFPEPPPPGAVPSCAEAGVLGVLPGIIGSLQANEVLKLLLGRGRPLVGRLLLFDALAGGFRELALPRDPGCSACGENPTRTTLEQYDDACEALEADREPEVTAESLDIGPKQLEQWLRNGDSMSVIDVRTPVEVQLCRLDSSKWIPMHEIEARWQELDPERRSVVYCHHGIRSAQVVRYLRSRGFSDVWNLAGGIDRWSQEVDPRMPRY